MYNETSHKRIPLLGIYLPFFPEDFFLLIAKISKVVEQQFLEESHIKCSGKSQKNMFYSQILYKIPGESARYLE